jgi:hypothetical protein
VPGPAPSPAAVFSTSFSTSESPISEGGAWTHNASNPWQKIQTTGANAIAAAYTEVFDDAYAYLTNWSGNNYEIIASVYWPGGRAGEVELLLRVSDSASQVKAYECLYNVAGSWQIVRWNGPLGDYTVIHQGGSVPGSGRDGNQIRATVVGSTITMYWRASPSDSWATLGSVNDSVLTSGKPGIAIYVHGADGNRQGVGFQSVQVNLL